METIVLALLMFVGEPQKLMEHYYVQDQKISTCIKLKREGERNSNATYQCAKVKAIVKDKKIISISKM
jgi:hypothetical protein|tara:strand:- start:1075 stop:1278 length:204 start_codon:yes stop_codon:yes gene_type:complete